MQLLIKITKVIFKVLRGIFLGVLVIIFILFTIPYEIRSAIVVRSFRRREAGKSYLVCSSRGNWHELLINNVIPVLPDNYRVVWAGGRGKRKYAKLPEALRGIFEKTPYIVAVKSGILEHQSLNNVLQGYKAHSKKSEETRRVCAMIINQVEEKLRRKH